MFCSSDLVGALAPAVVFGFTVSFLDARVRPFEVAPIRVRPTAVAELVAAGVFRFNVELVPKVSVFPFASILPIPTDADPAGAVNVKLVVGATIFVGGRRRPDEGAFLSAYTSRVRSYLF